MSGSVKVRVAVAVDPDGEWNAVGWAGGSDKERLAAARDLVGDGEACYWLEATVAVPAAKTAETWVRDAEPTMLAALKEAEAALAVGASYRATDQDRITKALATVREALATAVPSLEQPAPSPEPTRDRPDSGQGER